MIAGLQFIIRIGPVFDFGTEFQPFQCFAHPAENHTMNGQSPVIRIGQVIPVHQTARDLRGIVCRQGPVKRGVHPMRDDLGKQFDHHRRLLQSIIGRAQRIVGVLNAPFGHTEGEFRRVRHMGKEFYIDIPCGLSLFVGDFPSDIITVAAERCESTRINFIGPEPR